MGVEQRFQNQLAPARGAETVDGARAFESLFPEEPLSAFEVYVQSLEEPAISGEFDQEPEPELTYTGLVDVGLVEEPPSPYTISTDIRQFGYELFQQPPSTFAPVDYAPVSPGYLLGPGDEIRISVWGTINAEFTPVIDIDGKIVLPTIGVLHLSGLTFSEGKAFIEKEFSRQFKPSQVKINVSMGRLRSLRVFVVGKARKPGGYTISSYSALGNALFAAGGPNKVGSLRDIQVKRNGKTLVHFDLYELLLKGDKTKDIRLMPEDVVFIPPVGPLAGIAGNVHSPAIYELKGETSLADLIDMAGGLNDIAFTGRIQIIRIVDNHRQTVLEHNLTEMSADEIMIQSGDVVKVFPIMENLRRVRLTGAVERAGEYGISPGMTVRDIIALAGGPKYYAFMEEAELIRVSPTSGGPVTEKKVLNLEKALAGDLEHNIALMEDDYLMVKAVPEWELYRMVAVTGEMKFPGIYTIRKGERLSSLIRRTGLTDKAYLRGAVFTRESVRALQETQLKESIDRLEQQILSRSAATIEAAISPESAQQERAAMEQRIALVAKLRAARPKGRLAIDFTLIEDIETFEGSEYDLVLEEGDTLNIPETPAQVQVIGSVYNQNAFLHDSKSTVEKYVTLAGGMTRDADKKEIYVLKVDGTAISDRETRGFMERQLDPGDTIVVPEKLDKVAWLRDLKDITQILYQIAVTVGVLIVAY
jgi:protein involved in polysaccharide export with SLBB domain